MYSKKGELRIYPYKLKKLHIYPCKLKNYTYILAKLKQLHLYPYINLFIFKLFKNH